MPVYCFRCSGCGRACEEFRPMADSARPAVCECGLEMARDIRGEQCGVQTEWPDALYSNAAGVSPDQVGEAREYARRHGVPVEYAPDGRAIFRSHQQRRRALAKLGLIDKDGFC